MGWQPETQPKGKPPKIIYLCDREKECNKHGACGQDCKHTTDIRHAVNFINLGNENYVEERPETPTIDAVPQWIPCSERLPEKDGYYLTTTCYRQVYCDFWNEDHFDRTEAVIAWMPLPKPNEGDKE